MSTSTHDTSTGWIDHLLREISALRQEFANLRENLDDQTIADFSHLFDAAGFR